MARIRTIKPEFFTSEDIVELEPLARLLYIALWCEADKEGRLGWKPRTFKMRYLPGDDCDIEDVCGSLVDSGLVRLYGNGLAYIPTFLHHQHINPRESVSVLPAPEDCPQSFPKKVTTSVRADVFERDGNCCIRCGAVEKLTLDHILPQSIGGPHIHENLRVMCRSCNSARPVSGARLKEDLEADGFTVEGLRERFGIDASPRVATRADQDLTRRKEGRKEGREGKEGNTSSPKREADPDDLKVSELIWQKVLALNPTHKQPDLKKWADCIRLMREQDNRTHEQITEVFLWANSNSFWSTNILSPPKLREKFDALTAKMNQGAGNAQTGNDHPGNQRPDTSAAGQVRADIARRRAERAALGGSDGEAMGPDGFDVRPQVGQQLRRESGPGPGMGELLEGDFRRAD